MASLTRWVFSRFPSGIPAPIVFGLLATAALVLGVFYLTLGSKVGVYLTTAMVLAQLILSFYLIASSLRKLRDSEARLRLLNESLEHTVRARTAELSSLSRHLLIVREEEKARIARELHDELGSSLTAVTMDIAWINRRLQDQPQLAVRLTRAAEVLKSTVETKRRIIQDLRPVLLDNLGLSAAIESYASDFSRRIGIPVEIDVPDELPPLEAGCPIALFRIFQEALTNVSRHAKATQVHVSLHQDRDSVLLEIIDNGIGIDTAYRDQRISHGLLGMRERALQIGGQVSVEGAPGGTGTMIKVTLPCLASEIAASNVVEAPG